MKMSEALEHQWPYLRSFLPSPDSIESMAVRTGALVRRREIWSADRLLRLAMVYGFCGYSLRQTAAWGEMAGVASVSDVALLKRFRKSADWMCQIVASFLSARVSVPKVNKYEAFSRIRLIDGSTMSKPGSSGADWRLHLGFDLRKQSIVSLELTEASAGESLRRVEPLPAELLIADRGYARANGLAWVLQHHAHFLVRLPWNNVPLKSATGETFDIPTWLSELPEATPAEVTVHLRGGSVPLRLLALRKSEPAAEASRLKILSRASNHTKTTDPRTLEAAGYTLLLTDVAVEKLPITAAFDLYRFRWQIELCFKSMKSVITLDQLNAKDSDLGRMVLATKLLGALLIEEFTERYVSFSPWGYPSPDASSVSMASG
jgi:hypothetical protein